MAEMSYQQFEARREAWESHDNRLMSREEIADFDAFFASAEASSYKSEGFDRARLGDFCQYETVEPMMKAYLGAKKCYDLYERYEGNFENPQLQQEIKNRLMEADLRAGFSLGANDPTHPFNGFFKACEKIANRQMMMQTLEEPNPTAKLNLLNQFKQKDPNTAEQKMNAALSRDLEQRVEMAKILFMNHLGKFQLRDSAQNPMEMNENMAEIYAHGGRTMFILPAGPDQNRVMKGIQGQQKAQSGLDGRGFATHGIKPRTFNSKGAITSEAKELKLNKLLAFSFNKHKGMDASIGGLGHIGPHGKMITADGTNGHMYMHLVSGGKNTCGTMLVGFENAGPQKSGRMGHAHGASAKKAGASAFISDKGYIGNEIGGRTVDLSGLSGDELATLLTAFESRYRDAALAAHEGQPHLLNACNELLTGKLMSVGELKGMLEALDVPTDAVEKARAGHPQVDGNNPISKEENPSIPLKMAENPEKKTVHVTECAGLVRPIPPVFMKKPNIWDKLAHFFSLFSKNSYVSKYKQHQKTLAEQLSTYEKEKAAYLSTLEALEQGGNPKDLKEAYDQAVKQAEEKFGVPAEKPAALNNQENPAEIKEEVPGKVEQLENAILDSLFNQIDVPEGSEQEFADLKEEYLGYIRETTGYNKLVSANDDKISNILDNSDNLHLVCTEVFQEISQKLSPDQPASTEDVPQENNEMILDAPKSLG